MSKQRENSRDSRHPLPRKQPLPTPDEQKAASAREVAVWLIHWLSTRLHIPPDDINVQQPFTRYGLGSIEMIDLTADLEDWLGGRLPTTLAWDYPTIAILAEYLGEPSVQRKSQEFNEEGAHEEYQVR